MPRLALAGERNRWFLVDREVESPHTSAFFVEKQKQGNDSKSAYDEQAFEQVRAHTIFKSTSPC